LHAAAWKNQHRAMLGHDPVHLVPVSDIGQDHSWAGEQGLSGQLQLEPVQRVLVAVDADHRTGAEPSHLADKLRAD
jgi:hypothetical protein